MLSPNSYLVAVLTTVSEPLLFYTFSDFLVSEMFFSCLCGRGDNAASTPYTRNYTHRIESFIRILLKMQGEKQMQGYFELYSILFSLASVNKIQHRSFYYDIDFSCLYVVIIEKGKKAGTKK